jgi:hypothetical protein
MGFDANVVCGPLHADLGARVTAIKRGEKQSGDR